MKQAMRLTDKSKHNLKVKGFTLMELMIVLAIISIITAIAYPSYLTYIQKSRRSDAIATLAQYQIILERCYAQNFSYSLACPALPTFPAVTSGGFYTIAISNLASSTYLLTATPLGPQIKDTTCATFTVNQANVRTGADNSGTSQSSCWNPT